MQKAFVLFLLALTLGPFVGMILGELVSGARYFAPRRTNAKVS